MSLADRLLPMALHVRGALLETWPGWSTGEILAVAIVLNRADVLHEFSYTLVEAFDRIEGEISVHELRCIERQVQDAPLPAIA
jgi:hypothetical protein